jgi:hypothetical protein
VFCVHLQFLAQVNVRSTTENRNISAADLLCLPKYHTQQHNLTSAEFLHISELTETTRPNTTVTGGIYHEVTNQPNLILNCQYRVDTSIYRVGSILKKSRAGIS